MPTGPSVAQALATIGRPVRYPKGAVVITEGDPSDSLYVVLDGRVKVFLSEPNGREMAIAIYGPGDYVGELALDRGVRSASVVTLEPSTLSCVTHQAFKEFLVAHPDAAFELVLRLIGRVRSTTQGIRSLGLMDVYGRVARLLLDLAVEQDGQLVVAEPMTQQQIAERVACSREMVSRIFSDLQKGGYIRIVNRRIHIERRLPARH
jgi:CRP/FNR family cyclic AMP-dependent transcriptional regulator